MGMGVGGWGGFVPAKVPQTAGKTPILQAGARGKELNDGTSVGLMLVM